MIAWKVYTDWDDFVVLAENITEATLYAQVQFDLRQILEKKKEVVRSLARRDDYNELGEDIPDWLEKELSDPASYFDTYTIYKVKKVGPVDNGEFALGEDDE
jgi:hypothetical protein